MWIPQVMKHLEWWAVAQPWMVLSSYCPWGVFWAFLLNLEKFGTNCSWCKPESMILVHYLWAKDFGVGLRKHKISSIELLPKSVYWYYRFCFVWFLCIWHVEFLYQISNCSHTRKLDSECFSRWLCMLGFGHWRDQHLMSAMNPLNYPSLLKFLASRLFLNHLHFLHTILSQHTKFQSKNWISNQGFLMKSTQTHPPKAGWRAHMICEM